MAVIEETIYYFLPLYTEDRGCQIICQQRYVNVERSHSIPSIFMVTCNVAGVNK